MNNISKNIDASKTCSKPQQTKTNNTYKYRYHSCDMLVIFIYICIINYTNPYSPLIGDTSGKKFKTQSTHKQTLFITTGYLSCYHPHWSSQWHRLINTRNKLILSFGIKQCTFFVLRNIFLNIILTFFTFIGSNIINSNNNKVNHCEFYFAIL